MKHKARLIIFAIALLAMNRPVQAEPVTVPYKGLNLVGEFVVSDAQTSPDTTILLLHGTLAHLGMETIKGLQNTLVERGFNSLAINLSFDLDNRTGMYDCAVPHRHRYTNAVAELSTWLDWLAGKGVSDVTLFGHSRGGAQAALFAVEKDHALLKRLVLLAPATWNEDKAAKSFQKAHSLPLAARLREAQSLSDNGHGRQLMKGVGVLYCPGADVTADSFLSYYAPNPYFDTPTLLPKIKQPVLIVAGGKDTVVADIVLKVKPMTNDRITLVIVDEADHFFRDLFAEDVVDAMETFFIKHK